MAVLRRGLACIAVLTGCMPYALPPVTGDVGPARSSSRGSRTGVHAEVGFAPLQLTRGQIDRPWDATLSGSFDRIDRDEWGVAAAAGPVLHPWGRFADEVANRLLIQAVGRWTTEGIGAGVRATVEYAKFVDGASSDSNGGAYGFGEAAIGLYAETARWSFDGTAGWTVTAGVTLRVPAMVGIACCFH